MSRIDMNLTQQADYSRNVYKNENRETVNADQGIADKGIAVEKTASQSTELSQKAKDLLNEMKQKYQDMDFFVANYSSDDEAQKYLSRGAKDYSALIEPELLERMAEDESIKEKYLGVIDSAKDKLTEVKDEIEKLDDTENGERKSEIKSLGFSVKADGSLSFFAELEKSSSDQKMRIEQKQKEKADAKKAEKKAEDKKKSQDVRTKKTEDAQEEKIKRHVVSGDTVEDLLEKIKAFDWKDITEEIRPKAGGLLDLIA